MSKVSVLTIVRNREAHLRQLIAGLHRSARAPDELVIVDMSDTPMAPPDTAFPTRIERLVTDGLPLAAARNRAASVAAYESLVFLDVDCIPMHQCLGRLVAELDADDALLCADIRYLGPDDARGAWTEADLLTHGRAHPARIFPAEGVRAEPNSGLFWSLAFAVRRSAFRSLGGFDETFSGYGAEDTDFGYRAAASGLPLRFVGGALACHQYHASHAPPVQHLADIARNAAIFRSRWGFWPMAGWLTDFQAMGLIAWSAERISVLRAATPAELHATQEEWTADLGEDAAQAAPAGMAAF